MLPGTSIEIELKVKEDMTARERGFKKEFFEKLVELAEWAQKVENVGVKAFSKRIRRNSLFFLKQSLQFLLLFIFYAFKSCKN